MKLFFFCLIAIYTIITVVTQIFTECLIYMTMYQTKINLVNLNSRISVKLLNIILQFYCNCLENNKNEKSRNNLSMQFAYDNIIIVINLLKILSTDICIIITYLLYIFSTSEIKYNTAFNRCIYESIRWGCWQ